ncbi:MAG: TIGR03085 family metal-binding protein [Ilumatobacteraceae bacterium]
MATDSMTPARRERESLCDLFLEVGPDAPTLCGAWTTRDLAAHLVMRERRPDGAAGIGISKLAAYGQKVQNSIAETEWTELVGKVRSGPPRWFPTRIPALDALANTVEFYVHHEDVRRAGDVWSARELPDDLNAALTKMAAKMARAMTRSSAIGVVLEPTDGGSVPPTPIIANKAVPSVTVRGPIGELVLFVYGRQAHSIVELLGNDDDIAAVTVASFGI